MAEHGYRSASGRSTFTRYSHSEGHSRHITFGRVRGADLGFFLSLDRLPDDDGELAEGIEAESPWWPVTDEPSLSSALDEACSLLIECGFHWLDDPLSLTPTEGRTRHNLLVRDFRLAQI